MSADLYGNITNMVVCANALQTAKKFQFLDLWLECLLLLTLNVVAIRLV